MEDQWKKDFEEFMESLYREISLRELISGYMKSLLAAIPYVGNYFSTALSSCDNALQMKALFRIFHLSKELEEQVETFHREEIGELKLAIRTLERVARQYEREMFPYQAFHSHQFEEVKTVLKFSPDSVKSHVERNVEKTELDDFTILIGKIGAGKTTSLVKIVERSKPSLIVVIKNDIRTMGLEKLYSIKHLGECVVIWDDIQNSIDKFLEALPTIKKLDNIKFIGAIRSTDYVKLEKDRYFGETKFKKIEMEDFNQKEVEKLVELLENEFEKPLKDLKPLLIKRVMEADGTPFYIASVFLCPQSFTTGFIKSLPEEVHEIWSRYFTYLDGNERCLMKSLRMIRENFGIPEEEFVRDVYSKAFHGDLNKFSLSLENLEKKKWISTKYSELWESRIIISKDAQIFCFEVDRLGVRDFYRCIYEKNLEPKILHVGILLSAAHSLLLEKDYEESEQLSNKAIELVPEYDLAYLVRGNLYSKSKKLDEAIEDFNKALELNPEYLAAYNNRGLVYCELRQFDKAIRDCNKALELDPFLAGAYNNRGLVYYELRQFDKAIRDYDKALELDPKLTRTYYNRGNVYYKLRQFDKAIRDCNKAIELDPDYIEAYNNRGTYYYELKKFDKAMDDFDKAIKLNPCLAEAYCNRGGVYYELNQFDEAMRNFDKAIELDPKLAGAYRIRGLVYYELRQFDKAIRDYDKALELDPKYLEAYVNRGNVYYELKKFEEALEDCNRVMMLDPKLAIAYRTRGLVYFELVEFDKALDDFSKAVELDPEAVEHYLYRGRVYYELKKLDEAMRDFNKVIELDSGLALAYYNRGSIYCKLKKFDEAMEDFNKAIELDSKLAEAYISCGSINYELKKFDEAKDNYSKAFEIILEKGIQKTAQNIFKQIFENLRDFSFEFRVKNGVYAIAVDYLRDSLDLRLLGHVWTYRLSLDESPEKIILYFLRGITGFEEDIFSFKNSTKNEKYLEILSEITESLKVGKITQELERSISEMEENTTAWNLLLLCLNKFLQ
ncbi:MAG: hypothetical protein AYK19_12255 [Theionarchaea archaeon DG-70-1]|nr:MAG: hypothetical protein AYK19_12255 [Theionarchaea archaeon DG-70-1]